MFSFYQLLFKSRSGHWTTFGLEVWTNTECWRYGVNYVTVWSALETNSLFLVQAFLHRRPTSRPQDWCDAQKTSDFSCSKSKLTAVRVSPRDSSKRTRLFSLNRGFTIDFPRCRTGTCSGLHLRELRISPKLWLTQGECSQKTYTEVELSCFQMDETGNCTSFVDDFRALV